MKVCVYGSGAIGSLIAARLAQSGADVGVVARGEQLRAISEQGLTLIEQDGTEHRHTLPVTDDPATLGPQDVVILAMKAHSVPAIATEISPLLGAETAVVGALVQAPAPM
jgi:2-dehydropantoate 2-reductase